MTSITKGKIAKEDINGWDGVSSTFARNTITGGSESLHSIDWVGVDVYNEYGQAFTDTVLNNAINAVGSGTLTFFFAVGTWTLSGDVTLPSNIVCHFPPGCTVNIVSGFTLTINGEIIAGDYEVFTGAGTLKGSASVTFFNGTWVNDTVKDENQFVVVDSLVCIKDHNQQVIHKFPKSILSQTSEWMGFH